MTCCPHCNGTGELEAPSNGPVSLALIETLRTECDLRGIAITWDSHLVASDAARFLKLSPSRLANMRSDNDGPPWRKEGRAVEYPLAGIGAWREEKRRKIVF